jgi:hypothetical protein
VLLVPSLRERVREREKLTDKNVFAVKEWSAPREKIFGF